MARRACQADCGSWGKLMNVSRPKRSSGEILRERVLSESLMAITRKMRYTRFQGKFTSLLAIPVFDQFVIMANWVKGEIVPRGMMLDIYDRSKWAKKGGKSPWNSFPLDSGVRYRV